MAPNDSHHASLLPQPHSQGMNMGQMQQGGMGMRDMGQPMNEMQQGGMGQAGNWV